MKLQIKQIGLLLPILLLYVMFTFLSVFDAAGQVGYAYDQAGNRTECYVLKLSNTGDVAEEEIFLEHDLGSREIKLYPNPTQGNLFLEITNGDEEELYSAELYDVSGKSILKQTRKGNGRFNFNITSYPSGTYLLILRTFNGNVHYKILKE